MGNYVSPDRSSPIAQANQVLQKLEKEKEDPLLQFLDRMLGLKSAKVRRDADEHTFVDMSGMAGGGSGNIHYTARGQTAHLYAPNGEKIASYNSNGAGWTIEHTQAEDKFLAVAEKVYKDAHDAARAQMQAKSQENMANRGRKTTSFDVQA